MTTFCETTDVEALLQGDITPDDAPKVVALLEMATELIELELGRPAADVEPVTETWTIGGVYSNDRLKLSRFPVASVDDVTEDGTSLDVDVTFRADLEAGLVHRIYDAAGLPHPWTVGKLISVTYTPAHPRGLRTICAQMVARAFKAGRAYATTPSVLTGLKQLTVGRWSATADTGFAATAAEALSLTEAERAAVRAHRDRSP